MSVSPNDLVGSDASTCWGSEVSEDIDDVSDDDGVQDGGDELDVGDEFEGDEPVGSDQTERVELEREDAFIRRLVDPRLPTPEEIKIHGLKGHVEFRNWCPVCIKARGKELEHTRDKGYERRVPEYSFDYCFPGDELGYKWTVLVGRERVSKTWMAAAVPQKGYVEGRYAVDKCLEFIHENGDSENKIIIKTDQEKSIAYHNF